MLNLSFSQIQLPNLVNPAVYPTVSHGPSCVDPPPDDKTCLGTPVVRVRQYALPTEPLGKLKFPWTRLRELIPVPPAAGVHCPTIEVASNADVGDAAAADLTVTSKNGDACLPQFLANLVFPCTSIEAGVAITQGYPATASWAPPVNVRDNKTCVQQLQLLLKLPGCTVLTSSGNSLQMVSDPTQAGLTRTITDQSGTVGQCLTNIADILKIPCVVPAVTTSLTMNRGSGSLVATPIGPACARTIHLGLSLTLASSGGTTSGGGFVVGTPADHGSPFGAGCCSAGYAPGAEVPIVDVIGIVGTAGAQIDPSTNRIVNFTDEMLVTGDTVQLVQPEDQPGPRTEWRIV